MKQPLLTALTLALASLALAAPLEVKRDAAGTFVAVPLEFRGSFVWEGDAEGQSVRLLVSSARRATNNQLEVSGTVQYGATCVNLFRAFVDRSSGALRMTEALLRCEDGAVSGVYVGSALNTLERLNATWQDSSGARGQLSLKAVSPAFVRVALR